VHLALADRKVEKVLDFFSDQDCCATATLSFQRLAKKAVRWSTVFNGPAGNSILRQGTKIYLRASYP
jgi:hypothetical protein